MSITEVMAQTDYPFDSIFGGRCKVVISKENSTGPIDDWKDDYWQQISNQET